MTYFDPVRVHESPRLTFSALAKLLGPHTPLGTIGIIRDSKHPRSGPTLSYANMVHCIEADLLLEPRPHVPLREHELDALSEWDRNRIQLPRGARASRPSSRLPKWPFHGVEISVVPDVLLDGPRGTGALKLYCPKEPLAKGVGSTMAALLEHHRRHVLCDTRTCSAYCLVYEVRSGKLHVSRGATPSLLRSARAACQLTESLWAAA